MKERPATPLATTAGPPLDSNVAPVTVSEWPLLASNPTLREPIIAQRVTETALKVSSCSATPLSQNEQSMTVLIQPPSRTPALSAPMTFRSAILPCDSTGASSA